MIRPNQAKLPLAPQVLFQKGLALRIHGGSTKFLLVQVLDYGEHCAVQALCCDDDSTVYSDILVNTRSTKKAKQEHIEVQLEHILASKLISKEEAKKKNDDSQMSSFWL